MKTTLLFSSKWLEEEGKEEAHMFRLQSYLIDTLAEKSGNQIVITTTRSLKTQGRDYRKFEPTHRDSFAFYAELVGRAETYEFNVYEDEEGDVYASYRDDRGGNIWKFHFISDLGEILDEAIQWAASQAYDDLKESITWELMTSGFLNEENPLVATLIEDSEEAQFYFTLPYMQESIVNGRIFLDTDSGLWLVDEDSVWTEDAYDTFIQTCLF